MITPISEPIRGVNCMVSRIDTEQGSDPYKQAEEEAGKLIGPKEKGYLLRSTIQPSAFFLFVPVTNG